MNKYLGYFAILSVVIFLSFVAIDKVHATASGCVTSSWVNIAGNGVDAKLNVTNKASCGAKQVSLCSYRVYIRPDAAGWLSTQTLFDSQTITLQPGQTLTMSVKTDNCMTQVDAYEGPCVNPFTSDNTSVPNIFAGRMTEYTEVMCEKCTDACTLNEKRCSGNGIQECKKKSNGCTAWEVIEQCDADETCKDLVCKPNCTDECTKKNQRVCSGNGYKTCGNYDSDSCMEWSTITDCDSQETCINGSCVEEYDEPTVNLTATGNGTCGSNFNLKWVSTDANSCAASNGWSGSLATEGSKTVDGFVGTKTFTIKCWGKGGTATDSVTLKGSGDDDLEVSAGEDIEIDEDEDVRLDGEVDGDYDDVEWDCTDGDLSDDNSLRPTFEAPEGDWDYDKVFTCTLTAENECGKDSDSVKIRVNYEEEVEDINVSLKVEPASGCAALRDVDLKAEIDSDGDGGHNEYEFFFDCENDGDWDKEITVDKDSYTAKNLCDYDDPGTYTAKVKVVAFGRAASDTATVKVKDCDEKTEGRVSITKMVRSLTSGTAWTSNLSANPGETISYRITIKGIDGDSKDVRVADAMPAGIENRRNLRVDGVNANGNLENGIDIGDVDEGQTVVITYDATITGANNFNYGQTTMTNTARVTANGETAESSAMVIVNRSAIAGATTVSTGFADSPIVALIGGFGAVLVAAVTAWRTRVMAVIVGIVKTLRSNSDLKLRKKVSFVKKNNLIG